MATKSPIWRVIWKRSLRQWIATGPEGSSYFIKKRMPLPTLASTRECGIN